MFRDLRFFTSKVSQSYPWYVSIGLKKIEDLSSSPLLKRLSSTQVLLAADRHLRPIESGLQPETSLLAPASLKISSDDDSADVDAPFMIEEERVRFIARELWIRRVGVMVNKPS
jgi:hypothetical protein